MSLRHKRLARDVSAWAFGKAVIAVTPFLTLLDANKKYAVLSLLASEFEDFAENIAARLEREAE